MKLPKEEYLKLISDKLIEDKMMKKWNKIVSIITISKLNFSKELTMSKKPMNGYIATTELGTIWIDDIEIKEQVKKKSIKNNN